MLLDIHGISLYNVSKKERIKTMMQPKTGAKCGCRAGIQRDNCLRCEGTGWVVDFKAIRAAVEAKHKEEKK